MITRRLYDPDHCTACGDFLPCGDSWIKTTDDLPGVLAAEVEVSPASDDLPCVGGTTDGRACILSNGHNGAHDFQFERANKIAAHAEVIPSDSERLTELRDGLRHQLLEDELAQLSERLDLAITMHGVQLARANRVTAERDKWERIAGERFAAANALHAKWQDAEARIERVRVDLDFIIGAYVGPPIPHEAIAIVLDMVDARLRAALDER